MSRRKPKVGFLFCPRCRNLIYAIGAKPGDACELAVIAEYVPQAGGGVVVRRVCGGRLETVGKAA